MSSLWILVVALVAVAEAKPLPKEGPGFNCELSDEGLAHVKELTLHAKKLAIQIEKEQGHLTNKAIELKEIHEYVKHYFNDLEKISHQERKFAHVKEQTERVLQTQFVKEMKAALQKRVQQFRDIHESLKNGRKELRLLQLKLTETGHKEKLVRLQDEMSCVNNQEKLLNSHFKGLAVSAKDVSVQVETIQKKMEDIKIGTPFEEGESESAGEETEESTEQQVEESTEQQIEESENKEYGVELKEEEEGDSLEQIISQFSLSDAGLQDEGVEETDQLFSSGTAKEEETHEVVEATSVSTSTEVGDMRVNADKK